MRIRCLLSLVGALVAGAGLAEEETLVLVRPGGAGRAYWNQHAPWFMYRPKLCFPALDGATNYSYAVVDDHHVSRTYEGGDSETAIPSEIWMKMPTGFFTVQCFGVRNGAKALAGERRCWKLEPFRPGAYPKAPRGYREAAVMGYEYLLDCPWSQTLRKTGRLDPKLAFACYPSTVCGSIIYSMLRLSALKPSRRAEALALARSAADYLMSVSEKPGAALEGLPPTYSDDPDYFRNAAVKFKGLTMLAQPAWAGQQILALGVATNERKYRDYGLKVAETFLRLQEKDGTWDWRKRLKDASGVVGPKGKSHRLYPVYPIWLMKEAFAATGDVRYRESADRAWRYILENPAQTFDWESQHEDTDARKEYVNLTPKNAADTVTFILERDPQNAALRELARDCMRFCEDQFVVWTNPSREGIGYNSDSDLRHGKDYSRWFHFPAACEQYGYLVPCDATAGRIVRGWVSLYKLTKDPLVLEKARAMGDALVRIQEPSGRIQTEWRRYFIGHPEEDWLDDMTDTLIALEDLASVGDESHPAETTARVDGSADIAAAARTQRLHDAKWGVFNHFLSRDRGCDNAAQWNAAVDKVDVERVADQVKSCGAGFYFLTIEQCTRFMCAPNATFDRIAGTKPGEACSRRDLPREMADAMKKRGIDFYLYFTGDGPADDPEIAPRFGCGRLKETGATPELVTKWASVLEEYARRYGRDVKGWWFDGMFRKVYRYTDELMEPFHRAVLSGNPDALVGMNNGVQPCNYNVNYAKEDFTAGEFNDFRVIPRSRFIGKAQAFTLIPLGKAEKEWLSWGCRGCKRDAAFVADYVSLVNRAGGVVAIDVYIADDGSFDPAQLEVLREVGRRTGTLGED